MQSLTNRKKVIEQKPMNIWERMYLPAIAKVLLGPGVGALVGERVLQLELHGGSRRNVMRDGSLYSPLLPHTTRERENEKTTIKAAQARLTISI